MWCTSEIIASDAIVKYETKSSVLLALRLYTQSTATLEVLLKCFSISTLVG